MKRCAAGTRSGDVGSGEKGLHELHLLSLQGLP